MNSDKLQHGYARFLLTQGRTAGEFAAFKAGVEYAEVKDTVKPTRHQYYYKNAGCLATSVDDPECICWRDEGTGPFPDARHDNGTSSPALMWRVKPYHMDKTEQQVMYSALEKSTVYICPTRDCECGTYPGNWCRDCPKHRNNGRAE